MPLPSSPDTVCPADMIHRHLPPSAAALHLWALDSTTADTQARMKMALEYEAVADAAQWSFAAWLNPPLAALDGAMLALIAVDPATAVTGDE